MGTTIIGKFLGKNLYSVLSFAPSLMALLGVGLIVLQPTVWAAGLLVAFWGVSLGTVPVAWSTWMSLMVNDEAESAEGAISNVDAI